MRNHEASVSRGSSTQDEVLPTWHGTFVGKSTRFCLYNTTVICVYVCWFLSDNNDSFFSCINGKLITAYVVTGIYISSSAHVSIKALLESEFRSSVCLQKLADGRRWNTFLQVKLMPKVGPEYPQYKYIFKNRVSKNGKMWEKSIKDQGSDFLFYLILERI